MACVSSLEDEYPAPYLVALRSLMMASPTASKPVAVNPPRMSRVGFKTMEKVAVDSEDSDGDESVMSSRVPGSRAVRDALKDSKRLGVLFCLLVCPPPARVTRYAWVLLVAWRWSIRHGPASRLACVSPWIC